MTIFHVLKYPPKEIIIAWVTTDKNLYELLPEPIAQQVSFTTSPNIVQTLEKILLDYEGPL